MQMQMIKAARSNGLQAFIALSALLFSGGAIASKWNMPVGVTEISAEVYDLHMFVFWICVIIGIVVFGAMFWSIFKHRKATGREPAQFHHSTAAEIIWTLIPFVILVVMAIPAAGTLIKMEDATGSDLTIKVTGYQWRWQYTYVDEGVDFHSSLAAESNRARQTGAADWSRASFDKLSEVDGGNYLLNVDKPMVVPVGKKVRLLLTAHDVIHAWWVPELGGKKDAIPGYINEMWFKAEKTGTYRGQCAELCGRDHGFMPIVVEVVSEEEYEAWLAANQDSEQAPQQVASTNKVVEVAATAVEVVASASEEAKPAKPAALSKDELMTKGETEYNTFCAACHKPDGTGVPPAFPSLVGSPVIKGPVADHINMVINGKPGTAMAPFGGQLDDEQIAAIVTYERNAWGNDSGDVVQPADIAAAR